MKYTGDGEFHKTIRREMLSSVTALHGSNHSPAPGDHGSLQRRGLPVRRAGGVGVRAHERADRPQPAPLDGAVEGGPALRVRSEFKKSLELVKSFLTNTSSYLQNRL